MHIGLRIDTCTRRGLDEGIPRLRALLDARDVRASWFVPMGPDRSGRAAFRFLKRRGFAKKMVRTSALKLYGLRTALSGTLLPSRPVGTARPGTLRGLRDGGHEVGIHGWDHVRWHDDILEMEPATAAGELRRAHEAFVETVGGPPDGAAAPGWVVSQGVLAEEERLGYAWASDTRGTGPFRPLVDDRAGTVPQLPATLPTLDEVLGTEFRDLADFPEWIADRAAAGGPGGVLTLHSEAEGGIHSSVVEPLLDALRARDLEPVPLGVLFAALDPATLPVRAVRTGTLPGRPTPMSLEAPA